MPPVMLLADANNFYASCEAALNPQLVGKPLLVLSNNDGCIVARSAPAKKLGFKMGQPLFQCLDLVKKHQVEVVSSNYPLYANMSARIMQILNRFAPQAEYYSIDEAFLALPGFTQAELDWHAHSLRDTVQRWTGITVSVGLAITKTLAKIANERAKKIPELEGVFDISAYSTEKLDELLASTEVENVWGIGRQRGRLLRQYGYSSPFRPDDLHRTRRLPLHRQSPLDVGVNFDSGNCQTAGSQKSTMRPVQAALISCRPTNPDGGGGWWYWRILILPALVEQNQPAPNPPRNPDWHTFGLWGNYSTIPPPLTPYKITGPI